MAEYVPRLLEKYKKEVAPYLQKKFGYKNVHEIPKVVKISVNAGVGEAIQDSNALEAAMNDLKVITGQKPIITKARKSISNFKLRQGMKIGAKVTLRRQYMWEFLDRYISVAVPRIRDFRGYSEKSFDGRGNYSLGVREQIIFPEINVDKIDKIRGFDITIVTTAKTDEEGYELLKALGFPFKRQENN
ncbi:MAG TPA: 50S ribosomal protein L5 [Caldithrix abyssi]|uniref:Large ribosomal subunit protein uL5 n=1 Tax=Caldithrix abyssi TaxID=187145 RepID=A0A7V4WTM8_CALAY|nr:50S ribosomal protein L5 [Caldithrix abyssi]